MKEPESLKILIEPEKNHVLNFKQSTQVLEQLNTTDELFQRANLSLDAICCDSILKKKKQ